MISAMTIKDVARLAEVSVTTVSRYMNGHKKMSAQTASRIQRIIEETGYRPNLLGRALKSSATKTIGVLVPSLSNPVFSEIIVGIQEQSRRFGYDLMILDSGYDTSRELEAVNTLLQHRVVGILLTVSNLNDNQSLSLLKQQGVPYCLVHNQGSSQHDSVYIDNFQAGEWVGDALVQSGHITFSIVSTPFSMSDRAQQRVLGFQSSLQRNHLDKANTIFLASTDADTLTQALAGLIPENASSTAWFCTNDLLAIALLHVLRSRGKRIPEDVSVVGVDGMAIGQMLSPPLSTVRVPHRQMGAVSVENLLNRIHGSCLPGTHQLSCDLLLQGTLAKPANVKEKELS